MKNLTIHSNPKVEETFKKYPKPFGKN